MKERILFCWSGGKDSALALHAIQQSAQYEVAALLTTITADYDRISMHGVRSNLLEKQAAALSCTLEKVHISRDATNSEYESRMKAVLDNYHALGVRSVAFGDIFLEDLRKYRQQNLAQIGMNAIFPIWKEDTSLLAHQFIAARFKAIITCVDTNALPASFTGRHFNEQFLADLPPEIDPCGENGEFHSFVYDGPIFTAPVNCERGQIVLRENRFSFCDLIDTTNAPTPEKISIRC